MRPGMTGPAMAVATPRLRCWIAVAAAVLALLAIAATRAEGASKRIAFDTSYGIDVVGTDGSGLRLIVPRRGAGQPRWSPDGRWILYVKETFADRQQIGPATDPRSVWLVRPDGTRDHRLVGPNAHGATWSKDGTEVWFVRPNGYGAEVGKVYAINITTRRIREVGLNGPTYISPDGRFAQDIGYGGLYNADGTPLERPELKGRFRAGWNLPGGFSPSGKMPYNCRELDGEHSDLCVFNPVTLKATWVPTPRGLWEYQGVYSPNGKLIAVSGRNGLFLIPAGGSTKARWLMRNPGEGGSNTPFNPTWEP